MLLIKKATIVAPDTKYHLKKRDLLINKGIIESIQSNIAAPKNAEVFEAKGAYCSIGWIDVGARPGDPGYEHREDLNSLKAAAAAGGFTTLAPLPNTAPVIQDKSSINYLTAENGKSLVDIHPLGALSMDCEGKELAELYDMHSNGAVGFTDGLKAVQHAGLLQRALLYSKAFNGVVMNHPHDGTISKDGQMHEGKTSTLLGMRGIPEIAETIMVQRDLELLEYTDSKMHFLNISSGESLKRISAAQKKGNKASLSIPALNIFSNDTDLEGFDVQHKVLPVIRGENDRKALAKAVLAGQIDFISSNHHPLEVEEKAVEFPRAGFGAIGLETSFCLVNTALEGKLTPELVVDLFAANARTILGIQMPKVEVGAKANLTIFDMKKEWTFGPGHIYSKSKNSPILGKTLKGGVLGVVNNGQSHFFQ